VADFGNSRVLEYSAPLRSGVAASRVFGQGGNFTAALANNGGISENSLDSPAGVALDGQGRLYVADTNNNRVLEYDTPLSGDTTADRVFGQPDFNHNNDNHSSPNATGLDNPFGVALDGQGRLFVPDTNNNRVLEYDAPLASGMPANRVFGQPDFTHNARNNGGTVSATSLDTPDGVGLDGWGNLYVADFGNNRVLEYYTPLVTAKAADRVFGQSGWRGVRYPGRPVRGR
jgi:sugar lactone lactonase YvrE